MFASLNELSLWWLILCVKLTTLRDAESSQHYFWIYVSISEKDFSIWFSRLSEEIHPQQYRLTSFHPLGHEWSEKILNWQILLELSYPSSLAFRHWYSWFSDFWTQAGPLTIGSPVLSPSGSDWIAPRVFQLLRLATGNDQVGRAGSKKISSKFPALAVWADLS